MKKFMLLKYAFTERLENMEFDPYPEDTFSGLLIDEPLNADNLVDVLPIPHQFSDITEDLQPGEKPLTIFYYVHELHENMIAQWQLFKGEIATEIVDDSNMWADADSHAYTEVEEIGQEVHILIDRSLKLSWSGPTDTLGDA